MSETENSARPRSDFIYTKNSARPGSDYIYTKIAARPGFDFIYTKIAVRPGLDFIYTKISACPGWNEIQDLLSLYFFPKDSYLGALRLFLWVQAAWIFSPAGVCRASLDRRRSSGRTRSRPSWSGDRPLSRGPISCGDVLCGDFFVWRLHFYQPLPCGRSFSCWNEMWGGFREAIVQKYGRASVAWVWHDCIYTKIAARPGFDFIYSNNFS